MRAVRKAIGSRSFQFAWLFTTLFLLTSCGDEAPKPVPVTTKQGLEFVMIPAGTFIMGSEDSAMAMPRHNVKLDSFEIMTTEVTNEQFERFRKRKRAEESQEDNGPVCGVKRKGVIEYTNWLSKADGYTYLIPTEAQWEYAARGGLSGKDYAWGNAYRDEMARMQGEFATPVKSYPPNGYGLYDVSGNASEMCWGETYEYTLGEKVNPRGPFAMDFYVSRGLGICSGPFPQIWFRNIEVELYMSPGLGFRLVRIPDNEAKRLALDKDLLAPKEAA